MRIVVAGGTGFLGSALSHALVQDGHQLTVLTRGPDSSTAPDGKVRRVRWDAATPDRAWSSVVDGADAVINLAGESIAGRRWSASQKQRILDSRVSATRALVQAIASAQKAPATFVSGSAVGYYGPLGDQIVTEDYPAGSDFLADVCRAWEAEAQTARPFSRVVCVRTGLVLAKDGGALGKMLLPFKLGAGGPLGSGRQYMPWIHRRDWVDLVRWSMLTASVDGPVNATGPAPVTNAEFTKSLGRALHRPAFMPAPAFALRLVFGEMADALLLSGQRAVPQKAERNGFQFQFRTLEAALAEIFGHR